MICQRTGYCCINLFVVVVAKDENGEWACFDKPAGVQCPNLIWEGNQASCAVHDEPWYPETPCARYQNSEVDPDFYHKRGRPCMLGPMRQKQEGGSLVQLGKKVQTTELENLGSFVFEEAG